MGDDILHNILARLPTKPLIRFKCVSMHWNRLISDPCFMKSRSRRMILLPCSRPLAVVDVNEPLDDNAHSIFNILSPLEHHQEIEKVTVVGTFNGIVVLIVEDVSLVCHMYLYNPLTGASKLVEVMDRPSSTHHLPYVFGLATDDLKFVRFGYFGPPDLRSFSCDVFDLKTSSWIGSSLYLERDFYFWSDVGMFLNGFLYWVISFMRIKILALDIKEMVFSKINIPIRCNYFGTLLGSLNGSLSMLIKIDTTRFDLWVMKEQGVEDSWLNVYSFTLGLEGNSFNVFHPMCISSNGQILLRNGSKQHVIYDTSKHSYKTLNDVEGLDESAAIRVLYDFNKIHAIEYVESLISPLDICFI